MEGRVARARRVAPIFLFAVLAGCLLMPEEGFVGEQARNRHPVVRITGGVLEEGGQEPARVHFYWHGADHDGVVRWFEWAIDDTVTEQAWNRTTHFDEVISFGASTPTGEPGACSDWHSFYVRAVDDDFERSEPDRRVFNAHTIAPTSTIESPRPAPNSVWASTLLMTWTGQDIDGSRPDKMPAHFEIKLVRIPSGLDYNDPASVFQVFADSANELVSTPIRGDYPVDDDDLYQQARRRWLRLPGTTTSYWLDEMQTYQRYAFVVRAIDEAGAVEQAFQLDVNYVVFRVADRQITVTLLEPALGTREYNAGDWGDPWVVSVAPDQLIRFQWFGDATLSGTVPGPCNYGFDLPDPDDESFRSVDGRGGWIGWANRSRMVEPISFSAEDEYAHYFYFKMRDVSNNPNTETRAVIEIRVADFTFDRPFLVVDDLRFAPKPCQGADLTRDDQTDRWRLTHVPDRDGYDGVLAGAEEFLAPGETFHIFDTFGEGDVRGSPRVGDDFVEVLGRYQTVIWDAGSERGTGLWLAGADNHHLSAYIGRGGNLLLYTYIGPVQLLHQYLSFDYHMSANHFCADELNFSAGYHWSRASFLWQFLGVRGCVDKPRGASSHGNPEKSLRGAIAQNPRYPDLFLDPQRWPCEDGVMNYEVLVPEIDNPDIVPWFEVQEGLEILYRAQTRVQDSRLAGAPVAWRTEAAAGESSDRGRVVCFGFHPYFFDEEAVESAFTQAVHWLLTGRDY